MLRDRLICEYYTEIIYFYNFLCLRQRLLQNMHLYGINLQLKPKSMMNLEVRSIMETNPKTTHPNQNVGELSIQMLNEGIQQLPVVEHGRLVGLITVRDLWSRYETKTSIADMSVKEVMNTNILRISPKDKVGTAAELFADKRFKTIPVVNLDNQLKGVITAFDIIKVAFNNEYDKKILFEKEFAM